ncbi:hypothetical protein B0H14DRAFT_2843651, partial [Mycena olivaceomarginata]
MGDSYGWLYSRIRVKTFSDMDPCDDIDQWTVWIPDLSLADPVHSEISALCVTDTLRVAVCFGLRAAHLSAVHDVPAASLHDRSLVLEPHLCGHRARTGSVLRFDTRLNAKGSAQVLFESGPRNDNTGPANRANPQPRSSVVFVQPIHTVQQLVVGYMDGRLGTYDLRFPRPIAQYAVTYAGNPFSLSWNGRLMSITLDPSERFLFAAGADHRVTLALALANRTAVNGDASRNPPTMRFATDFSALQVVDADDGPGQVLWANGESEVWRWRLSLE